MFTQHSGRARWQAPTIKLAPTACNVQKGQTLEGCLVFVELRHISLKRPRSLDSVYRDTQRRLKRPGIALQEIDQG